VKTALRNILPLALPVAVSASEGTEQASRSVLDSAFTAAIMLVGVLAVAWLLRRTSRMRLAQSDGNAHIRVLSQKSLGMREKLVLVDVDGARILLGITQNNIQCLHSPGADSGKHPEAGKKAPEQD